MLSQCVREIAWFLNETAQRQTDQDISLWNAWSNTPVTTKKMEPKLAWTIVGEPNVVYAITGLFTQIPSDTIQKVLPLKESNSITDWVTFTYVLISKLKEATIQTPVTLCIEKRLPSQVRGLFNNEVVHSIVSTEPIKLPVSLQHIHVKVHPAWSFEALLQPIAKSTSPKPIKLITLLDSAIIEITNRRWTTPAGYQNVVDQIVADSLNRYWLTNNPKIETWLIPTLISVKELRERVNYQQGDADPSTVIKELQQWIQQLATH